MPKGARKNSHKKAKRVEECLDDTFENRSVASSQGSFDTQSNPDDDTPEELGTEAEEVETNFEQVLEEHIQGASEKSAKIRQTSLKAISGTFANHLICEFVSERKDTILDLAERSLKRGQAEDQVCAAPLAVLLCVQLGYGSDSEHIFKLLKSPLISTLQDPTARVAARASCGTSLALCCFLASEEQEDLVDCVTALQSVFSSGQSATKSALYCECLFAWALLLSIAPDSLVEECVDKQCRKIIKLMQNDDVNLRIAAGEVFALICELGREKIEGFDARQFGVYDILKDLATDGTKHRAKKDRRQQRSSFRDILRTIEDGTVPEETIKFGHETMYLYTWAKRRQYAAFKDILGPGVNLHLKENQLLRDIFELGPPVTVDSITDGKATRNRRKMYNNAASKARTLSRGKHRDKRSFVH